MRLPLALLLAALATAGCVQNATTSTLSSLRTTPAPSPPSFDATIHWEPARAAPREIVPNDHYATGAPGTLLTYVHGSLDGDAYLDSPQPWRLLQQNGGWLLVGGVTEHHPAPSGLRQPPYTATLVLTTTGTLPDGAYTAMVQCVRADDPSGRSQPCQSPAEAQFAIMGGRLVRA